MWQSEWKGMVYALGRVHPHVIVLWWKYLWSRHQILRHFDPFFHSPLPHGIRTDAAEVCLFTKDEPNMTPDQTERFYKKLLTVKGVERITEVLPKSLQDIFCSRNKKASVLLQGQTCLPGGCVVFQWFLFCLSLRWYPSRCLRLNTSHLKPSEGYWGILTSSWRIHAFAASCPLTSANTSTRAKSELNVTQCTAQL